VVFGGNLWDRICFGESKVKITKDQITFFLIMLPFAFLFCGGIATILGKQDWITFFEIFIFYIYLELTVFSIFKELKEKSGTKGERE